MKIRKAVFPVAGLGTRFLPATKALPKEMLPLVDKPLIQYVVEEAVAAGIEEIVFVTGRGKSSIEDHFDISFELETFLKMRNKEDMLKIVRAISSMADCSYIRQKEPKGLGHAILKAKNIIGNEPFAVLLGDDIVHSKVPVTKQLIEAYDKYNTSVVGIEEVPMKNISQYGAIKYTDLDDAAGMSSKGICKVVDMVEKPPVEEAPSNFAIVGRYLLTPEIFELLEKTKKDKGGEIQLTNGLRALLQTQQIHGCLFEGKRYDAGNKLGFLKATVEFALRDINLGGDFRKYLKELEL